MTPAATSSVPTAPYHLVPNWGQLPPGMSVGRSAGDGDRRRTERFSPSIAASRRSSSSTPAGKVLKTWGEKMFVWPHGIRVDRDGYLWITDGRARDGNGQQVFKFAPDGKLLMTLGTAGVSGEGPTRSTA